VPARAWAWTVWAGTRRLYPRRLYLMTRRGCCERHAVGAEHTHRHGIKRQAANELTPGQLLKLRGRIAAAGFSILWQYTQHRLSVPAARCSQWNTEFSRPRSFSGVRLCCTVVVCARACVRTISA